MTNAPGSTPPPGDPEFRDGLLRDVFRRVLETGAKSLTSENLRQAARELRLPKDVLQHLLTQIDEGKSAFYKAVAHEFRGFLESSNLAEEIARALTLLTFEAKVEVRFRPSEKLAATRPDVSTKVRVRHSEDDTPNHADEDTPTEPTEPTDVAGGE